MDSRLAGVSIPPVDDAPNQNRARTPPRFLTSPGSASKKTVKFNVTRSRDVDTKEFKPLTQISTDWDADLQAGLNLLRAADGFAELDTKPPSEFSIDDGSTVEPLPKPFPGVIPVNRHDATTSVISTNSQVHEFSNLLNARESPLAGDPLEKERVLMAKRFQEQSCEIEEMGQLEGLTRAFQSLDKHDRNKSTIGVGDNSESGGGNKQGHGNLVEADPPSWSDAILTNKTIRRTPIGVNPSLRKASPQSPRQMPAKAELQSDCVAPPAASRVDKPQAPRPESALAGQNMLPEISGASPCHPSIPIVTWPAAEGNKNQESPILRRFEERDNVIIAPDRQESSQGDCDKDVEEVCTEVDLTVGGAFELLGIDGSLLHQQGLVGSFKKAGARADKIDEDGATTYCEKQFLPTRRQRIRAIQVIMHAKSNLQRHRVMEVMERVADIQDQLSEQANGVEKNPHLNKTPPPKGQNKQDQKTAWLGATLQCKSRNLLGQTKKQKSGAARCKRRFPTGAAATEWEGSKFKIALLESMLGKLMMRLGMLVLRHNWEWRRDLSALIETVEEIQRGAVLRSCLGGFVSLVHVARENQEKCRRQFFMRLKVRIRSALQFWRSFAHHRSTLERKVAIGLHAHHRLLKISSMSHWALMVSSSKESKLQKAVAKEWRSLRKKVSVWCAWRKTSFKSGIVRAKLAGGNWEEDVNTVPPKEFTSLWRAVCGRTVNRGPLVSLSCKKRHLLSHLRFSTTRLDVRWARETAGVDAAKCAVHRAFAEAREGVGLCRAQPGGRAESPSLFLGHWENDSRLEKQVWRHEQAQRETEEAWLALGQAQDEAAERKANFEHAIQGKEELVKLASEKVDSIQKQEEGLLAKFQALEQEQRSAQIDLHYSKTDLACAVKRIAELKAGVQDSMAEELLSKHCVEELQEALLSVQATENETKLKVKESKKRVVSRAKKEKDLREKMTEAETRYMRAKEKHEGSKEQVKCLSENLSRARHFDERKGAIALAKARNDVVRAEERCTASGKEFESWKSRADALTCETREAEAALEADLHQEMSQNQRIVNLQKRMEAATTEHSASMEEKKRLSLELKTACEEKTRVEERIAKIEAVVLEVSTRVQRQQEALTGVRSVKEKAAKENKYCLQALEKLQASMGGEIASLDAEVESRLLDVEDCTARAKTSKTLLSGKPDLLIQSASSSAKHHRPADPPSNPDMHSAFLEGKMDVLLSSTSCSSAGSVEEVFLEEHQEGGCTQAMDVESTSSDTQAPSLCGLHLDCNARCVEDAALLMHARVLAAKAFEVLRSNVDEARKHAGQADMMYRIPLLRRYLLDWRAAMKREKEGCYNIWAGSMMKKGWEAWWGWHARLVWKFEKQRELEARLIRLRTKNCFQILRDYAEKCSFRRAALDASVTLKKMRVFVRWQSYTSQRAHFQARLDIALEKLESKNLAKKFGHWAKLVHDKMLLTGVFSRAEQAWEELGGENRHIEEYHLLSSIFAAWHVYAEEEISSHRLAEAEQIALTHSKTNALLRGFQAWKAFVEQLEHDRLALDHRNSLFHRWRQCARDAAGDPISLLSIRLKLKRAGFSLERHVYSKSLLRRAVSGWQLPNSIARQHYRRQMLAKGIAGIRSEMMMADACVLRFFLEWKAPRSKNKAFLAWRAVTKVQARRRSTLNQAFKHYEHYLVWRTVRGWKRVYCMGHEMRCRMEAAAVHYDNRIQQQALFSWQKAVERARLIEGHRGATLMGKGMDGFRTNRRENVDERVIDYIADRQGGFKKRVMESSSRSTSWEAPVEPEPVQVSKCPATPLRDEHIHVPSFLTLMRKSPQDDGLLTKSFGAWKLGKRRQPRIPRRRHHPLVTIDTNPQSCQSDGGGLTYRHASAQVPSKTGGYCHSTLFPSRFQPPGGIECTGDGGSVAGGQYWVGPYTVSPRKWYLWQDAGVDPRTVQCLSDLRNEREVFR